MCDKKLLFDICYFILNDTIIIVTTYGDGIPIPYMARQGKNSPVSIMGTQYAEGRFTPHHVLAHRHVNVVWLGIFLV